MLNLKHNNPVRISTEYDSLTNYLSTFYVASELHLAFTHN